MSNFRQVVTLFIEKNLVRIIKYSASGFVGFLSLEILTFLGITFIGYPYIIEVDVMAFSLAVAIEFLFQEYWTTRRVGEHHGHLYGLFSRLLKFELLNVIGNIIAIVMQLILLKFFGLYPLIGNFIGSMIAFPFNYYIQMRAVWKIKLLS